MGLRCQAEKIFIGLFLCMIGIPWIGTLVPPDTAVFAKYEQRPPAELPRITKPKTMCQNFERWFGDRFLFRQWLTGQWSQINYELLAVSVRPDKGVVGKDDWLFLGNFWSKTIDQYRGTDCPSQEEIQGKVNFFRQMQRELAQRGISFLVVLVPDKHTLYSEKLPEWMGPRYRGGRLEQLDAGLNEAAVPVLNLQEALEAAKARKKIPLYYETDSHWNQWGAYWGYQAVGLALEKQGIAVGMLSEESIRWEPVMQQGNGDISNMLQLDRLASQGFYLSGAGLDQTLSASGGRGNLSWPARQQVMTQERQSLLTITNPQAANRSRVLFLEDSFGDGTSLFWHQSLYQTSHLYYGAVSRDQKKHRLSEIINECSPQAVVFQVVERELWTDLPKFWSH